MTTIAITLKPILKTTDSKSNNTPDIIFYCDKQYEYIPVSEKKIQTEL